MLKLNAIRNTFKAYERLKREQHIDTLFRNGKAFSVFPLKLIYLAVPRTEGERSPVRVGFSVPKKKFRKSVERHRVRRLVAEAWRLNKQNIYPVIPAGKQLHLFIIYTDNALPAQQLITEAVVKGMEQFSKILSPRP